MAVAFIVCFYEAVSAACVCLVTVKFGCFLKLACYAVGLTVAGDFLIFRMTQKNQWRVVNVPDIVVLLLFYHNICDSNLKIIIPWEFGSQLNKPRC